MTGTERVFRYCERGLEPGFWAEPLNAVTNAGFVLVGALAMLRLARHGRRDDGAASMLLAATVIAIGIGSFLFHTLATPWAQIADTAPIGVFMLGYLAVALRTLLALTWPAVGLGLVIFAAAIGVTSNIDCNLLAGDFADGTAGKCLNGTLAYVPALLAVVAVGSWLHIRGHAAAPALLGAAGTLLLSMLWRSVDIAICGTLRIGGHALGSHFGWHVLNAIVLHQLLRALVPGQARPAIMRRDTRSPR